MPVFFPMEYALILMDNGQRAADYGSKFCRPKS
jgi:hypothetical protein